VYNLEMIPVATFSVEEAITRIWQGRAQALENHPTLAFRSAGRVGTSMREVIPVPLSIIIFSGHRPKHWFGVAKLNGRNLQTRDGFRCAYCGRHASELRRDEGLTRDHVFPRSRGGTDTWENLLCACAPCNNRKADRTPEEAGMRPIFQPWTPKGFQIHQLRAVHRARVSALAEAAAA
jgi:5-methylcytosine-specific restriction endonuclease McrA